ncbi:MAG: hypothetical protein ABIP19_15145 [Dermatophilaceae bacterium]
MSIRRAAVRMVGEKPATGPAGGGSHGLVADPGAVRPAPRLTPSPVLALNRTVAVAEVEGPDAALALVDGLDLVGYHLLHAIRADLLLSVVWR